MSRTQLLARTAATAAATTLLAGLAAAPATARPDPGEPAPLQIHVDDGRTKAQIEHDERLLLDDHRNKAQIEHDEQLALRSTGRDDATTAPEEFPWAVASVAAAGLAAVATGGVVALRHRRTTLLSAPTRA